MGYLFINSSSMWSISFVFRPAAVVVLCLCRGFSFCTAARGKSLRIQFHSITDASVFPHGFMVSSSFAVWFPEGSADQTALSMKEAADGHPPAASFIIIS